ncbi:MAG: VanZ family protein [Candidatus Accumulibacter sp.]|nr:VanZ family protein [Accumulibacter sp.]
MADSGFVNWTKAGSARPSFAEEGKIPSLNPFQAKSAGVPKEAPLPAEDDPRPLSRLPRYLAIAYLALIVHASLHPFSGWRAPGLSPFVFLEAAWPRYWTAFDLSINVAAYLPLGFLLARNFGHRMRRLPASLTAIASGAALSLALESLQSYLPSRVPSSVDLLCNGLGASLGAALSFCREERFFTRVLRARQRRLAAIPYAEYGLVLTALWLLAQLSPETLLFGTGDLRNVFDIPPGLAYDAPSFFALEAGVIACDTLAVGLIAGMVFSGSHPAPRAIAWFFLAALSIRTLATAILVGPQNALAWLTPGAELGVLGGGVALALALLLPIQARIAVAGLALMGGTVLVNIAPFNPYSVAALAAWRQGHFLNFNGLTRLTASFWPFLALPYPILLGRRI